MSSSRPYLIRAVYDWVVDNGLTPQFVVDAGVAGVEVPREHVRDGRIVLNVAPRAVRGFSLGNDRIRFGARFAGVPFEVALPPAAVVAVVARETGVGMTFPPEAPGEPGGGDGDPDPDPSPRPRRPVLKVVE